MKDVVDACLAADVPVVLNGQPGTGKTSFLLSLAADAGATIETLIGSQLDPADVGGIPVPDATGQIVQSAPAWARRLKSALDEGRPAWLFLDELSAAPRSVQAALLRVVFERRVADLDLTGCRVIAACNPPDTAADNGLLVEPMRDRFHHVNWSPDATEWCAGESRGWGNPLRPEHAAVVGVTTDFIRRNPKALVGERTGEGPVASPRSWSALAKILSKVPMARWAAVAKGSVGESIAAEFGEFVAKRDVPDPEDLLSGRSPVPKRGDTRYAALMGLAVAALSDRPDRDDRISKAWEILGTLTDDIALPAAKVLSSATASLSPVERRLAKKLSEI